MCVRMCYYESVKQDTQVIVCVVRMGGSLLSLIHTKPRDVAGLKALFCISLCEERKTK